MLAIEVYQQWSGKSLAMLNVFKDCLVKLDHDKTLKLVAVCMTAAKLTPAISVFVTHDSRHIILETINIIIVHPILLI